MSDMEVRCEKCGGSGTQHYEEDGRNVSDTCYRCSGSGRVDQDTAHHTQMEQVAHILAVSYVDGWRKHCNEDPEGEGWAFRAAEDMMSESDYTKAMTYDKSYEVGEELSKLSHVVQVALINHLLPKPKKEEVKVVATPIPAPIVVKDVEDDDIPF